MGGAALVTGASRGIGRAAAIRLARAGYDVALAARTVEPDTAVDRHADGTPFAGSLQETAREVRDEGARALTLPLDLQDRAAAEMAVGHVIEEWGRLDLLVNNALYVNSVSQALLLSTDPDEFARLLVTNVVTPMVLTQRAVAAMLERGDGGCVINVVSAASRVQPPAATGSGGWAFSYAAVKAAFSRLTPMIHVEHGAAGIRSYGVEPGGVATDSFRAAFPPESLEAFLRDPAMNLVSENVPAAAIEWLARGSADATALSGRTLDCERLCREHRLLPESEIGLANPT